MKNLDFSFGYNGSKRHQRFSYWLCNKLPFIPTIDARLFSTYKGGEGKGKPYVIRHQIYLGIFKYYYRIEYLNKTKKWRVTNLTEK